MRLSELVYQRNSAEVFQPIAHEPWSLFFDSGFPYIDQGRYDIIAGRPYATVITRADVSEVSVRGTTVTSHADPFRLVQESLGDQSSNLSGIPFCGGAAGYFAYDLGRRIEKLPELCEQDLDLPDMAIGLYDWAVVIDHQKRRSWLVGQGRDPHTDRVWDDLERLFRGALQGRIARYRVCSETCSNMTRETYFRCLDRIKRYIVDGDCYQVNLAQRFDVSVEGDPWDIYLHMRRTNPAPFSGFFRLPEGSVLSSSPERFLHLADGLVETRPIKGTIRRSVYAYEDKALAAQLLESEKDRAENLMIVDLLRNDIGKNCRTGSVSVPRLFGLESFATVHHLVSTVTGRLAEGKHAVDLLRGCFPGGSVTGAPKLRAMQIIEELEPHRRSVYCGSLGYIGFDGSMDSNIVIRTAIHQGDHLYYWAGGAIVADSKPEAEYEETYAKAATFLRLFDRKRMQDVGS